VLGGTTDCAPR